MHDHMADAEDDDELYDSFRDVLMDANILVYLDWKEEAGEIVGICENVARQVGAPWFAPHEVARLRAVGEAVVVEDRIADNSPVEVVMPRIAAFLSERDWTLMYLDEGSDAYPYLIVPHAIYERWRDARVGDLFTVSRKAAGTTDGVVPDPLLTDDVPNGEIPAPDTPDGAPSTSVSRGFWSRLLERFR